jgi:signal transduction histidine kinase
MSDGSIVRVHGVDGAVGHSSHEGRLWLWLRAHWEFALASIAVASAVVAFWVTLRADFLAYPDWLAVQKADFILGPIGVGLYWMHRRPRNRFGLLLVVLGLFGIPYILQSSSDPTLFSVGSLTEFPRWLTITIVTLAFPSGRLEGLPEWLIIAALVAVMTLVSVLFAFPPHVAGFTISNCRVLCPGQAPMPSADSAGAWLFHQRIIPVMSTVIALSTAVAIASRFATGTPPRRRALAIGTPIALLFMLVDAAYRGLFIFAPNGLAPSARPIQNVLQWADAVTRSLVWYGFLFALIAAELFAGRVLRDVVGRSLGRPSLGELEGMLCGPLGDAGLRLGFWRPNTRDWAGHDGAALEPPKPGQRLTEVKRDGRPAVAIVHDAQLAEDPELLQAAGAAALLAVENTELDAAWKSSLRDLRESRDELAESRSRLAMAAERERRKLERNLHDGAQQRLVAASINLSVAAQAEDEREHYERIADAQTEIHRAINELREIAHGIYPTALARSGLSRAFEWLAGRHRGNLIVTEAAVGRFAPEIELAVYYCGLEAVQNASKHAGPEARISIRLYVEADQLHLEVRDNGAGFDVARGGDGVGLQNMSDRITAIGGRVDVISKPGRGTLVAVSAPVRTAPPDCAPRPDSAPRAPEGIPSS